MNVARRVAFALCVLALLAIALRLAWLGDDAYITLRSVENWVRGNGLRWNPGDRVQTYTHPAWMLLLSAGRWCTGEVYFTTLAISLALSLGAIVWLFARATSTLALLAVAALLAGTRAFVEYTTSGLETPLTYVLLVAFVAAATRGGEPLPRFRRVVLLAALLATTRMDLALLAAPAVLAATRGVPLANVLRSGAAMALPFLAWLAFAFVYYGSPFPVTAHAKAFGVGIPAVDLAAQGVRYALFALTDDPLLLATVLAGVVVGAVQRATRWLALGALLYVGYVVKVGGDFMAGRFFLPPFVVAVAVLARWLSARPHAARATLALAVLATLALALLRGLPPWLRAPATDVAPTAAELEAQHGIGDERRVYYAHLGLFGAARALPQFGALHAEARPGGGGPWILLSGAVGRSGFGAGAHGHVIDPLLCDPLLTRLPARDPTRWRIGHVLRRVPEGYYETLAGGENRLHHAGLRDWYTTLRAATRAPVFAPERWAELWRQVAGGAGAGLRDYIAEHYHTPPRLDVDAASLPGPLPPGTLWFDEPRLRVVYDGGFAIRWPAPQRATTVRMEVLGMCDFRCRFLRGDAVIGEALAQPLPPAPGLTGLRALVGLRDVAVTVPAGIGEFDTIWLDAVENVLSHTATGPPALGAIQLAP